MSLKENCFWPGVFSHEYEIGKSLVCNTMWYTCINKSVSMFDVRNKLVFISHQSLKNDWLCMLNNAISRNLVVIVIF
jgi:hypothetical protein